ncbi:hypothetical protein SBA4_3210023 [Candidatus Sulfopaludibacter sp. SbA4]|nr:hypothetical protein SBA4_3210023 [Candidatus Sulfopaludibacter sp. SbA4]
MAPAGNYTVTPTRTGYTFSAPQTFNNLSANQTANFTATPITYTISGQVTASGAALAGVTVTLSGSQTGATTTDNSGNYTFTALAPAGNYTVTPTRTGYAFSAPQTFNGLSTNQTANFTATPITYTISGQMTLSGTGLPGVTVTLTGSQTGSATTDNSGNYSFTALAAVGNYTVTPTRTGYTFSAPQTFNNLSANQTANFTATPITYTISGQMTVSGTGLPGVTVTLTGSQPGSATTDNSGNYSFTALAAGGNYTVTPSRTGYTFSAPQTFNNLSANQTANFTATPITYTISGQVTASGAGLTGVTMTLSGSQTGATTTDSSGNYSFTGLAAGGNYTVTPTRSGYTFTSPQTFNNLSANQTANFTATPISQSGNPPPSPDSLSPSAGAGTSQTFVFTFSDQNGWQDLEVVDILINNYLDGRNACYLAYSRSAGALYLVNDPGTALLPGLVLNASGITGNSQCTVTGAGSAASGSGNTLTLTLSLTFGASFAGNKVMYLAARDLEGGNSGWQALGTWNVPGPAISGPSVRGMALTSFGPTYTFTFTDTNGWQDIAVADILINSAIDGRHACYVAIVPSSASGASLFLVDDAGDAAGPYSGMVLPGSGSVTNSQCSINGTGSSITGNGTTLTLTLAMTFSQNFVGNQIFYLAARSNTLNSDWQAVGSVTVP